MIIGLLALTGLAGVLPVSWAKLSTGTACPHIGPLPACHLVSVAYALVLLTVLHPRFWKPWLFFSAWVPIFALAMTGAGLELAGQGTCPQTANGTPKCFISLAFALALLVPAIIHLLKQRSNKA